MEREVAGVRRILPDRPLTSAETQKRYRERHPARTRAALYAYRAANPERTAAIAFRSHHRDPVKKLLTLAKGRAKKKGLVFSLQYEDIHIPERCPVLGILLVIGGNGAGFQDASPTLDRVDNRQGYIPGNVLVVSWRANRLKCDATKEELRAIADFYNAS